MILKCQENGEVQVSNAATNSIFRPDTGDNYPNLVKATGVPGDWQKGLKCRPMRCDYSNLARTEWQFATPLYYDKQSLLYTVDDRGDQDTSNDRGDGVVNDY